MTDTELLRRIIKERGFALKPLSARIGLSYQGFWNKVHGLQEFRQGEIIQLSKILDLTEKQMLTIFFTDK